MDPIQNQASVEGGKKSHGALIGIIVVIVVLAVGGYFFWNNNAKAPVEKTIAPVSQSDEVESINADLGAGTGADLDLDFSDIEIGL